MATPEVTAFELLISGYSAHLLLPTDLITLIGLFYRLAPGVDINMFLVSCSSLKLCNLWSGKEYNTIMHHNDFGYFEYLSNSHCITNKVSLPSIIKIQHDQDCNASKNFSLLPWFMQKNEIKPNTKMGSLCCADDQNNVSWN